MTTARSPQPPDAPTTDRTVSMARANVLTLAFAGPLVGLLALAYGLRWGWPLLGAGFQQYFAWQVFLPVTAAGILAHELLHAFFWVVLARQSFAQVRLGFQLKTLTPYAHVRVPIPAHAYRWGAAAPGLLLGVLPALVAISATGSGLLVVFGLCFTLAAGGDLVVIWLLRHVPGAQLVQDHPERAGCRLVGEATPSGVPA